MAPSPVVLSNAELAAYFAAIESALTALGHTPTILWTPTAKPLCSSLKLASD